METEESKRFRSFAERYIVERAPTFREGEQELEDAWKCILAAKSIYNMTDQAANAFRAIGGPGVAGAQQGPQQSNQAVPVQAKPHLATPVPAPPGSKAQAAARRAVNKPAIPRTNFINSSSWTGR